MRAIPEYFYRQEGEFNDENQFHFLSRFYKNLEPCTKNEWGYLVNRKERKKKSEKSMKVDFRERYILALIDIASSLKQLWFSDSFTNHQINWLWIDQTQLFPTWGILQHHHTQLDHIASTVDPHIKQSPFLIVYSSQMVRINFSSKYPPMLTLSLVIFILILGLAVLKNINLDLYQKHASHYWHTYTKSASILLSPFR